MCRIFDKWNQAFCQNFFVSYEYLWFLSGSGKELWSPSSAGSCFCLELLCQEHWILLLSGIHLHLSYNSLFPGENNIPSDSYAILIVPNFLQEDIHLASGTFILIPVIWLSKIWICIFFSMCMPFLTAVARSSWKRKPTSLLCSFHDSSLMDTGFLHWTWGIAPCWNT